MATQNSPDPEHKTTWRSDLTVPAPADIRRAMGNMTQPEFARLAGASVRAVEDWLSGARRPDSARWELVLLRLKQHPTHDLTPKHEYRPAAPRK